MPPKLVLPVAATKLVEPPSHCNLCVKAESHSVCFAVVGIAYPEAYVRANVPVVVIGVPLIDSPVGTVIATEATVPVLLALDANNLTVPELSL